MNTVEIPSFISYAIYKNTIKLQKIEEILIFYLFLNSIKFLKVNIRVPKIVIRVVVKVYLKDIRI